ncbi:Radical SAM domain protein [Ignisphaera aggregans DSM 17230]|uniref:Radical SAM domain protein n=1 Tax=Ignisphaera aggregans (strain DSM 17230 / JCM 13409 / AQ1.S1) TaxID=583356 RepID=E0SS17_IGNAA|nr:Radical SAM domain protein [Ignisphaera aggregans DSM 17230]
MGYAHRLVSSETLGIWYGDLAKGCKLCMTGSKAVIFITGICGINCFYCPISYDRRKAGAFYIDEERIYRVEDILDELYVIRAEGASITGGEPFQRYDLTVRVIEMIKNVMGRDFHIHLYTSGFGATKSSIKYLDRIGLDEIRFHIVNDSIWRLVGYTVRETSMDVGIEIPVIPNDFDRLWRIVLKANEIGVKFVNLNELEITETNAEQISLRGYRANEDGKTVKGSRETAEEIIRRAYREGIDIAIHFCPTSFKDSIQHRNRLIRKAYTCIGWGEKVTEDGLLKRGEEEYIPLLDKCSIKIAVSRN